MPVDVYSIHDQAVIVAALPAVHPDDVEMTVHRNTATIHPAGARCARPGSLDPPPSAPPSHRPQADTKLTRLPSPS